MEYQFFELGIAYLCGIMLPGPSIALLVEHGLLHSRRSSIYCSIGIMLGIAIQSALVLVGANFLDKSGLLFRSLKIICPLFLVYLGVKSGLGFLNHLEEEKSKKSKDYVILQKNNSNTYSAFVEGFLIEVFNPVAITFFITIFTSTINIHSLSSLRFFYWIEIVLLGLIWFCGVAYLTSTQAIVAKLNKFSHIIGAIASIVFLYIGAKMLVMSIMTKSIHY